MGTNEDESSTERFWTAGFHHFMALCCLECVFKLLNGYISLNFQNFSGCGKPQMTEIADKGVRFYLSYVAY